jgi:hypothetical protein
MYIYVSRCYSHYGDLSPDKLEGEYPDFEECLHVLGGAKWGPREGGDEARGLCVCVWGGGGSGVWGVYVIWRHTST